MKLFSRLFIIFCCVQSALLYGHGFGHDTWVQLPGRSWQSIETICSCALKKAVYVTSYDFHSKISVNKLVKSGGQSTTNGYIRLGFDPGFNDSSQNDIVCTPTQEFYMPVIQEWVYASRLKIGDLLLSSSGELRSITYIQYVPKLFRVYTIEVEDTHNFFVGRYSILTHNMVLPVAFSIGFGMSIGTGAATGASIGSFFGPVTVAAGLAMGGVAGLLVKAVCSGSGRIPSYHVEVNSIRNRIDTHGPMRQSEMQCTDIIAVPTYIHVPTGCGGLTDKQRKEFSYQNLESPGVLLVSDKPSEFPIFSEKEREIMRGSYNTGHDISPLMFSFYETLTMEEVASRLTGLIKNSKLGRETDGPTDQYILKGTYSEVVERFNEFEPIGIKSIVVMKDGEGLVGILADGKMIIARSKSGYDENGEEGPPTLEIQDKSTSRTKYMKFRFEIPHNK